MAQGRKTAVVIKLTDEERVELESWQRRTTIAAGLAMRGRIILLLAAGESFAAVSRAVGVQRPRVYKWAKRFLKDRIDGLSDRPGRGRKAFFPAGGGRASGQVRL